MLSKMVAMADAPDRSSRQTSKNKMQKGTEKLNGNGFLLLLPSPDLLFSSWCGQRRRGRKRRREGGMCMRWRVARLAFTTAASAWTGWFYSCTGGHEEVCSCKFGTMWPFYPKSGSSSIPSRV
jgi:hypothetical protein